MKVLLAALALAGSPMQREVDAGWAALSRTWTEATHRPAPPRPEVALPPGAKPTRDDVDALRHQLAHRFIEAACPSARGDALAQELFALAATHELPLLGVGPLTTDAAEKQLAQASDLESRRARHALAQLVAGEDAFAPVVRRCTGRAQSLEPKALASTRFGSGDALVVLSRHSGEVLLEKGDAKALLPVALESPLLDALGRKDGRLAPRALAQAVRALGTQLSSGPGWAAAMSADLVVLVAHHGAPQLAEQLLKRLDTRAESAASVQVLGLLPAERVEARCPAVGVALRDDGPHVLAPGFAPLASLARPGRLLCLGDAWRVRFPGSAETGRRYAGTFSWSPPPPYVAPPGSPPSSDGQRRAREGSPFVFTTRLASYVAGVLNAEDSQLAGEPQLAVAQVVAHDASSSRHPGRPVCDTTHCQAFQGTAAPDRSELAALTEPDALPAGWLPFSQGGDEPWTESRTRAEVTAAVGPGSLSFAGDTVRAGARELTCETLRNALHLPGCPDRATRVGETVRFSGRGRGHRQGLDLERAKQSDLGHEALLRETYSGADKPPQNE